MKTKISILTTAALLTLAAHGHAQETGVSHPETLNDNISATAPVHAAKPSPAVPLAPPAPVLHDHPAPVTAAIIVRPTPAPVETSTATPQTSSFTVTDDINSGVVTDVPSAANELPEGTLIKARLNHEISTEFTERNTQFEALLTAPVSRHGIVMLPAGAVLSGRITEMRSGRHIGKGAAIHLEPESITMPDGSVYKLNAQVIDVLQDQRIRVTSEGTIISNDPTPGTVAALGATTATGAVTGAVLGGGVGAVVGAGIGAGVSTAVWVNQTTTQTLHEGTQIVFSLSRPMLLEPTAK
jgi:hypothetical protein